ncbi:MAG: RNA polymerase sigma factor [Lachnospiraceae bacterium]|nr:RNA polymerase sigma factor [Lachnospiraceae bacterium]
MNGIDLNDLFNRVRDGDKEAFTHIYHELKQPVFTIICRIVQNRELAEDLTQDVFVKVFTSPPDCSVRNPRAWIFRIARNLAIDALRKTTCADIDVLSMVSDDFSGNLVTRLDLEQAIAALPRTEREILALHLNGALGFFDIAHIVGLSVSATYRKYRKALKTLRNLLDGGTL